MGLIPDYNLTFARPPARPLPADSAEMSVLAGHLRGGRCALFVGAGLSVPAGLPTWGKLIDRMIHHSTEWAVSSDLFQDAIDLMDPRSSALREPAVTAVRKAVGRKRFDLLCRRLKELTRQPFDLPVIDKALTVVLEDSLERAELAKLSEQKRYAELAGHCRDKLGRERFQDFVRSMLTPTRGLPATHRDIVRTPFSCVVTTNFDTLLEDAYARYTPDGVPRAPTGSELGQQGTLLLDRQFFVLKAHGDALRPDTMIFTADDYRRVIHANPPFQAIVSAILLTHAVLFVGYSLSDTNFRLLLDNHLTIFNGNVPPRYAILEGVGDAECDILWRTAKLQVLPFPDRQYKEVGRCLGVLAEQTGGAPKGPVRRARDSTALETPIAQRYTTLAIESDGTRLMIELVKHRPGGETERQWTGGAVHPDMRRLGAWLRAGAQAGGRETSPMPDARHVGAALAGLMPASLIERLRRVPRREPLEIACSSASTRIPWEWALVGRGPLCLNYPVVRRPVDITHAARGRRAVKRPPRALVLGDAGTGDGRGDAFGRPLDYAEIEARTIEALLVGHSPPFVVTRLPREEATHERVLTEVEQGDYDVIHFGGHAWFDDREAYFYLWDRIMLGAELVPLLSRRPPALMMLNTHYTAFVLAEVDAHLRELLLSSAHSVARGREPRGFAEAAMQCGVTSFVGTFGDMGDRTGAAVAVAFYAELLSGSTVAEALRAARRRSARSARDLGIFYTAFGYPDFRLVSPPKTGLSGAVGASLKRAKVRAEWR